MWKHLAHPNIVPLLGMTSTPLQLISKWMPNGDLTEYIGKHPNTDRLALVSVPLVSWMVRLPSHKLRDVTDGLYYLHSRNVVHGDLKGVRDHFESSFFTVLTHVQSNILVDVSGHARITDFGLASVTRNLDSIRSASDDQGHTARWTAPEILNEQGTYSKEADVFSLAMVMIEVSHWNGSFTLSLAYRHLVPPDIYRRSSV